MFSQMRGTCHVGAVKCAALFMLALSLVVARTQPAEAQQGRGIATGIGVGIGAAILLEAMKESQRQQSQQYRRPPPSENRAPRPSPTQQGWMSTADVTKMQAALKQLGYEIGTVDGRPGTQTSASVRKFQKDSGQEATGELTRAQFANLLSQARTAKSATQVAQRQPPTAGSGQEAAGGQQAVGQQSAPTAAAVVAPPAPVPSQPAPSRSIETGAIAAAPAPSASGRRPAPAPAPNEARGAGSVAAASAEPAGRDAAAAPRPSGPRVSTDGNFHEYTGERIVASIIERSSIGRRLEPAACSSACLSNARCSAYMSYIDGSCELAEDVEKRLADAQAKSEVAVLGVRRPIEAASGSR